MTRHSRLASLGSALIAILGGLPAQAAEGRIPIFEPTTIAASGSYVVTRDITAAAGTSAIIISDTADNVSIDLNGFTVATSGNVHVIDAVGLKSLTVRNGTLLRPPGSGFVYGLNMVNAGLLTIENVHFISTWVRGNYVQTFIVRNNTFPTDGQGGIVLLEEGAAPVPGVRMTGVIEGNLLKGFGSIKVSSTVNGGRGVIVRNNRIEGGNAWAILIQSQRDCVIVGNRIDANEHRGIALDASASCRIEDNEIFGVGLDGIEIRGASNLIRNNTSSNNGASGIRIIGSFNHIEGNLTNSNALAGIYLQTGTNNTYGGNVAHGNQSAPGTCVNPAITSCPTPYGTGSSAPDFCDDATSSLTFCDNLMPGPPRS